MKEQLKNRHLNLRLSAGFAPLSNPFLTLPCTAGAGKVFKFRKPLIDQSLFEYLDLDEEFKRFIEVLKWKCQSCGDALSKILELSEDDRIYSGFRISEISSSADFLLEADRYGVNRIFLENVGFLDVGEKKTFHILKDKEESEICFFVREELRAPTTLQKKLTVSSDESISYFSIADKTVLEFLTISYCKKCHVKVSNKTLKEVNRDVLKTLTSDKKVLFFIEVVRLIKPDFDFVEGRISQLSLPQIYLLGILNRLYFTNIEIQDDSSFPIFSEFREDLLVKIKELTEDLFLTNNNKFYQSALRNSVSASKIFENLSLEKLDAIDSFSDVLKLQKKRKLKIILLREGLTLEDKSYLVQKLEKKSTRFFEYQGIDDYETNYSTNNSLLSFLGFNKEIVDLYVKHPLSKQRGLKAKDFSYSNSSFQCSICSGSGILAGNLHCSICHGRRFDTSLSDISWRGLWIGELMNTNFHNFQLVMGKLFPKKTKLLNTLLAFGLGELKLGDSLKLLDPLTRQKFSFLKFFQQKFKANDLILLDGVHPVLMSSELIREMAFQIFEDLVAENVKLVLVSRIF